MKPWLTVCLITGALLTLTAASAQGDIERIPDNLFPLTTEPATLDVFLMRRTNVEDYNDNAFTRWYEEQTGVQVNIEVGPSTAEEFQQALNLRIASGDLPDIILGAAVSTSQLALYGQQGLFLPLNDFIDSVGTETQRVFELYPQAEEVATAPDGNIYSLPEVNDCYHCSYALKMWIYQPWLDALGLEMPTTTEEFRAVLEAFRTQDPNGNGQADEIPLLSSPDEWFGEFDQYFSQSFVPASQYQTRLFVNDGVIDVTYNKPEFRDLLRYLRELHDAGLVSSESFTIDVDGLRRMLNNPDDVIIGATTAGFMGAFADTIGQEGSRFTDYVVVPPLEGPNGARQQQFDAYQIAVGDCVITATAEDPELAFRWCDAMYNEEVYMHAYYGVEGEDWRWATPEEVGINGEPAWYVPMTTFGTVQRKHWDQTTLGFRSADFRLGERRASDEDLEVWLYEQSTKLEPYAQPLESVIPPLYFSAEQAQELADLRTTLERFVAESVANFTLGNSDINDDAQWESYLQQLEQMGLPRLLEIYQAAYQPE